MKRFLVGLGVVCAIVLLWSAMGDAANTGVYQAAGDAVDYIIAILWKLAQLGVVGFAVYAIIQVAGRNVIWGLAELALAVVIGLLVFVILPPVVATGTAAGATLDPPAIIATVQDDGLVE